MGDAGFMISSIMNAGFQNQPGPVYNFSEPSACRNSYSYSPSGSEPDFCIESPPPPPAACNIVSSTTMPIIANGAYACMAPNLQQVAQPCLRIIEQPASKIRYRYVSEKGAHGGMQGRTSSQSKKTYPTVKLENAPLRKVYIKASLYTNEPTPQLHVHKLSGKNCDKNRRNGECVVELNEDHLAVFPGLGINFTGKKEVDGIVLDRLYQKFVGADDAQLKERAEMEAKNMKLHLNSVLICFEAFDAETDVGICPQVFSQPVQNQKSSESGDLRIAKISACSGACTGGDQVFLLCEKVNKKDIKIRFFEEDSTGRCIWEAYGDFNDADVHHQVAIVFQTPGYKDINIQQPVTVSLELYRMKDRERSNPFPFTYRPVEKDPDRVAQKRKKLDSGGYSNVMYATQQAYSGASSGGLRPSKMQGGSYSQGHISPNYQSRGSSQPQESSTIIEGTETPDSDSDISDLITFHGVSSTESSVSSTTETVHLPTVSALSDNEMPTSTIDRLSPNRPVLFGDPMWNAGSSSSSLNDDDNAGNQSIYFSDSASMEHLHKYQKFLRPKSPIGTKDAGSHLDFEIQTLPRLSPLEEETSRRTFSVPPRERKTTGGRRDMTEESQPHISGEMMTGQIIYTSARMSPGEPQHRIPADAKMPSSSPSRIGTLVLHSRGSTQTSPRRDVRTVVQNVARALRRFLASGDVQLLLYPMRDLMGVTDEDGDNAVHHIALHQGREPQFVDSSLEVVQHLPHAVLNQTNNQYQTPLQLAVALRKLNVLAWLLACGADPNVQDCRGHAALHLSVSKHHHDCQSILLRTKIKHKPDLNLLDYKGLSPLHVAVSEGCQICVENLCVAGADVNARNGTCGQTSLHLAVEHSTELLDILLAQEDVLVDAQDYAGNTALHVACGNGNLEAALKLMWKDANPLIENFSRCICEDGDSEEENDEYDDEGKPKGETPLDIAEGNETMRRILAGTISSLKNEGTSSSSKKKESVSHHFSRDEVMPDDLRLPPRDIHLSHQDQSHPKESTPASRDSGFISAEIKETEDKISRLCECLDPPNTEWEKLAAVFWDQKHIDQICKLEKSPTRAVLRQVESDQIEECLIAAGLKDFIHLLRNENPVH